MKNMLISLFGAFACLLLSCKEDSKAPEPITFTYNFAENTQGWIGDFADYPVGEEDFYELTTAHTTLPIPLQPKGALKISGNNHSDDLFMFFKKKITGLQPNETYRVHIALELASDVPDNSVGVGGSPGEGVYVKAGASTIEPLKIVQEGDYRMNIDKNNQAQSGVNMRVIGHIANGTTENQYKLIQRTATNQEVTVSANAQGELWLIVGTDSAFEATTTLYYSKITAKLYVR